MKTLRLLLVPLLLFSTLSLVWAEAEGYNYMDAKEVHDQMIAGSDIILLDIQFTEAYNYQHLKGAIPTFSYPLKTEESKAKLTAVVPQLLASGAPIVIITTRGGGGALTAVNLLKEQGLDASRLYILRGGQQRWPFPEVTEKAN